MPFSVTSRLKVKHLTSACLNLTSIAMVRGVDVILVPLIIHFNLCLPYILLYMIHLI